MSILASRNTMVEDFDWVIASLKNKKIILDNWITHTAMPEQLVEDFSIWLLPETGAIKVMLAF